MPRKVLPTEIIPDAHIGFEKSTDSLVIKVFCDRCNHSFYHTAGFNAAKCNCRSIDLIELANAIDWYIKEVENV